MKKTAIWLAAALIVTQLGLLPATAGGSDLYTENFNETSKAELQAGGDFSYVARPVDGVAADPSPVADGTQTDRALLSGGKDNRKMSLKMDAAQGAEDGKLGGTVIFEGEFRLEGEPAYIPDKGTAPAGTVKFYDFLSASTSMFTLGLGTFDSGGYKLRPLYADATTGKNATASIVVDGQPLSYKTWYHLKAELDTVNGKVTAYIGGTKIVDNQNFWGGASGLPLTQIQATHANGAQVNSSDPNAAHRSPFLLDNVRLYRSAAPEVTSEDYVVSGKTISAIPSGESVGAFLGKITPPDGTSSTKVYAADGATEKTEGTIETGDWLKVEPGGLTYLLTLEETILYEPFDGAVQSSVNIGAGWKLTGRPADGAAVDYDAAAEPGEDAGVDRALLSKALSGNKVTMELGELDGTFETSFQFRVEEQSDTLKAGGLRIISLMGNAAGGNGKDAVGLSTGSSDAAGFHLRPIYGPPGTALNDRGPSLAYRTWHTAVIRVNVAQNSASILINGENIFDTETVSLWNDTFQSIKQLQFYGKSTASVNFLIDTVHVRRAAVTAQAQSTVYTVDQDAKTITNVPFATAAAEFLGNMTYTENGSGMLQDSSGAPKTEGAVVTGDKLTVTPGGAEYAITVNPQPQAQSATYAVDQEEKTIKGVAFGTTAADFLGNMTYTQSGSGALQDSSGAPKTEGAVVTGDKLTVTPGGMEYSITVDPEPPPEAAQAQSSVYIVVQLDQTITGVPFGTAVADFLGNITYTNGGSGSLQDSAGTPKTEGVVVTGDKLAVTPGDAVYVITVNPQPEAASSVYTVDQEEKMVTNVPYGTAVADFLENMTYTEGGTGSLTDSMDLPKADGAVVTGDKLVVMPGGEVYAVIVNEKPFVPAKAESTVYEVDQENLIIRGVPSGENAADFLDNITYTEEGGGTLMDADGMPKTGGAVHYTDTLAVEPGGTVYRILTTDILSWLDFNDQKVPPAGWKMNGGLYIPKQRADKEAGDFALYSQGGNNAAANQASFSMQETQDVEITMDFMVEKKVEDANANQIKLCELVVNRKDEADAGAQTLAVCNVAVTSGITITHYPGNGTSVGRQTKAFGADDWGKWHSLKVIASVERNSLDAWMDGEFLGTGEFQGAKKDSNILGAVRFYNGVRADYTAAEPSPYWIDNLKIKTVSGDCTPSSEVFKVGAQTVGGILKGTEAGAFWRGITLPAGASAKLYSVYDENAPQGNAERTEGAVESGDKLVVIAENQQSKAVFSLLTVDHAAVYFTDGAGNEVSTLSQLGGSALRVKAEIFNDGFFGDNQTFVLVVTAYRGNEMVHASYQRARIPVGSAKGVIQTEPITVEEGLTYSAVVWDELIPMAPLSQPGTIS